MKDIGRVRVWTELVDRQREVKTVDLELFCMSHEQAMSAGIFKKSQPTGEPPQEG